MSKTPSIYLKAIPEKVFDLILEKQWAEKKNRKKINISQAVIILLKEAYLKDK